MDDTVWADFAHEMEGRSGYGLGDGAGQREESHIYNRSLFVG